MKFLFFSISSTACPATLYVLLSATKKSFPSLKGAAISGTLFTAPFSIIIFLMSTECSLPQVHLKDIPASSSGLKSNTFSTLSFKVSIKILLFFVYILYTFVFMFFHAHRLEIITFSKR